MKKQPLEWTEDDLLQLIGQPESFTLEFKESQLCKLGTSFARTLAKEVSAFANAEGGTIVLGVKENRGRPRVALDLDEGVDPNEFSLEQLQHIVELSIRPKLPGIQCRAIPLSGERQGRVAYVIAVPRGGTAYQASDFMYYTRNSFRNEPMQDHLVRLLMLRGESSTARLDIGNCDVLAKDHFDEYRFELIVENTGKQTVEDFLVSLRITIENEELQLWAPTMFVDSEEAIRDELKSVESMLEIGEDLDEYKKHEILQGPGIPFQSGDELRCSFRRIMQLLYQVDGKKIFPQDRIIFPGGKWLIEGMPHDVPIETFQPKLHWTIYLDDAPPCSGSIDLGERFRQYQEELKEFF